MFDNECFSGKVISFFLLPMLELLKDEERERRSVKERERERERERGCSENRKREV